MSTLNSLCIFAFLMFLGIGFALQLHRSSYGAHCNNDEYVYCDASKDLFCNDKHTCTCLKEDSMFYNETQEKCLVRAGERCLYKLLSRSYYDYDERELVLMENFQCVQNALCENGYCKCDIHTYENSDRLCSPKLSYGESCTRHEECSGLKNLICVDGQCACNKTESIFDPTLNQCLGKVGQSCDKFGGCTRNAFCPFLHRTRMDKSPANCACRCHTGYVTSSDGMCQGKLKSVSCHPKFSPCADGLVCSGEKCDCIFPELQSFNGSMEKCVSHLHSPCSEIVEGVLMKFPCEANAECKSATDNDFPECLCKKGYVESKGGHCKRIHGARCESHLDCDQVNGLTCRNGKCSCGDLHEYEKDNDICRGLVGARCKIGKKIACVEGAVCQPVRDDEVKGVCRCIPTFHVDESRKCNEEMNNSIDDSTEDVKIVSSSTST